MSDMPKSFGYPGTQSGQRYLAGVVNSYAAGNTFLEEARNEGKLALNPTPKQQFDLMGPR